MANLHTPARGAERGSEGSMTEKSEARFAAADRSLSVARVRQAQAFNQRRVLDEAQLQGPEDILDTADLVIVRQTSVNHLLKPGELPGTKRFRGSVRGPFTYVKGHSHRYATLIR